MTRAQMERLRERAERTQRRRDRLYPPQVRVVPRLDWRTFALLASGDAAKGPE